MQKPHHKLGSFARVADNLYRYSSTKKYYVVLKRSGKTKWIHLHTTDRELANRRLKEELARLKKTDPKTSSMTLNALLELYEQSIEGLAEHAQETRKSILKSFKKTWPESLEMQVRSVTKGQLQLWLGQQQARLKKASWMPPVSVSVFRIFPHVHCVAVSSRERSNVAWTSKQSLRGKATKMAGFSLRGPIATCAMSIPTTWPRSRLLKPSDVAAIAPKLLGFEKKPTRRSCKNSPSCHVTLPLPVNTRRIVILRKDT
jgi:hypothetical protein